MALDTFNPYLFVSAGEQSNKFLTPTYADGIARFQAQRAQELTGLTVRIDPIQEGTGDPAPDNIRPISGRTGLTVTAAGKNLIPYPYVAQSSTLSGVTVNINTDGSVTIDGTAASTGASGVAVIFTRTLAADLNLKSGDVLYFSAGRAYDANSAYCRLLYADNNSGISRITEENKPITITDPMISREINFQIWIPNGVTVNDMTFKPVVSLSPTEWQTPIMNQTYPVTWETEAGTVYGGTLDVVSGVLTVDWGYIASYDGETLPGEWISDRDVYAEGTTPTTGAEVAYKLAEPVTYQLDPEQIETIPGYNQIYSDAGPVIDIKF